MKKIIVILMSALLIIAVGCGQSGDSGEKGMEDKPVTLETEQQKAAYALGYNMGTNLKDVLKELDFNVVIQGIKDGSKSVEGKMTQQDMQKSFREFNQKLQKKRMEERKIQGEKNKVEGTKFLEENAKKEGVKVTASGLQYTVLKEGSGPNPKATDTVQVHYRGTFLDGEEFDSSFKRNQPAKFPLKRVIAGWTEGLQLMKAGGKYKFFIPAELAYKGGSRSIPPNATLIFEVELLSIEPPAAKGPPRPRPQVTPRPKKK